LSKSQNSSPKISSVLSQKFIEKKSLALYQGTTLVGPQMLGNMMGFGPEAVLPRVEFFNELQRQHTSSVGWRECS
jgi:hypothetical protein